MEVAKAKAKAAVERAETEWLRREAPAVKHCHEAVERKLREVVGGCGVDLDQLQVPSRLSRRTRRPLTP